MVHRVESRKRIDFCEDCFKKPAKYVYSFWKIGLLSSAVRVLLLCEECIKKPEYKQLDMENIQ